MMEQNQLVMEQNQLLMKHNKLAMEQNQLVMEQNQLVIKLDWPRVDHFDNRPPPTSSTSRSRTASATPGLSPISWDGEILSLWMMKQKQLVAEYN